MGRSHTQIESTGNVPREVRVAAAHCLLKNKARAATSTKGRERNAQIANSFFHETANGNGIVLNRFFHDYSSMASLYAEGVRSLWRSSDETDFKNRLSGSVLAEIAVPFLVARESVRRNTFIDASTTLEVMKILYPGAAVIDHPYGQSLEGISVPDGLVVSSSGRIIEVVEVKASLDPKKERDLETQLLWERDGIRNEFPELTTEKGPELLLVTPHLDDHDIPDFLKEELARKDSRIGHVMLPLNRGKLAEIIDDFFRNYRPTANERESIRKMERVTDEFGPTLAEIWREKEFQENRGRAGLLMYSDQASPSVSDITELARAGVVFDPVQVLLEKERVGAAQADFALALGQSLDKAA